MPPSAIARASEPPEGLRLRQAVVSPERQRALLDAVDASEWRGDLKRRVQHYGWRYNYRARSIAPADRLGPLPDWLEEEAARLTGTVFDTAPDQVIVNEYRPGQGISPHIDCRPCFGDTVASLSLGGACVMRFCHPPTGSTHDVLLAPGSLLILNGATRHEWTHGIAPRKSDVIDGVRCARERRVSLTFRTVRIADRS